jgi:hypothetical protein
LENSLGASANSLNPVNENARGYGKRKSWNDGFSAGLIQEGRGNGARTPRPREFIIPGPERADDASALHS